MSITAVSMVGGATTATAGQHYECATNGCNALTEGYYCDTHRELCEECGAECERGTRILYAHRSDASIRVQCCDSCAREMCGGEIADGRGLANCWCSTHRPVAAGAVR
jgi:hypothetical protein